MNKLDSTLVKLNTAIQFLDAVNRQNEFNSRPKISSLIYLSGQKPNMPIDYILDKSRLYAEECYEKLVQAYHEYFNNPNIQLRDSDDTLSQYLQNLVYSDYIEREYYNEFQFFSCLEEINKSEPDLKERKDLANAIKSAKTHFTLKFPDELEDPTPYMHQIQELNIHQNEEPNEYAGNFW